VPKEEAEKLVERYGVTKDIPRRKIEEEVAETRKKPEQPEEEIKIPDLILRLEKIDGKLEVLDRSKADVEERLTHLAEEIGELRTMILERERSFDKLKSEFEKVQDTVSGLEPGKIKRIFEKTEKEILENKAKIETVENLTKALAKENKKLRKLMEKIKSFENLVDISYEIDRKISQINDAKNYVDVAVSKVESIFSELNEKVSQLENQREKIEKLDELTIEITKMLDEISVKLTKFVQEKDLKEFKRSLEEDLVKLLKEKIPTVKVTGDEWVKASITELSNKISRLKSVVESQNAVIMNIIERLEGEQEVGT
jgi:chromosome segregation ATPase